jgi:DNA modification methylase
VRYLPALATVDTFRNQIVHCDAETLLRSLPANSVHCVVTSPPYYGLRDYGTDGQIGLEDTPAAFVARLVDVFEGVRRVLRPDGVCWLNLGDTYGTGTTAARKSGKRGIGDNTQNAQDIARVGGMAKQLLGIPWRVAFALQAAGWWLRSDIIWHKPNPMPESVTDRPTKAHEYVFMLTKSARYWYDADAVRDPATPGTHTTTSTSFGSQASGKNITPTGNQKPGATFSWGNARNKRTVWTVPTEPKPFQHFAMFPQALIEPMILAGCPKGGIVLDPFMGSGTTALVAQRLGRDFIGCDVNEDYVKLARDRVQYHGDDKRMVKEQAAGVQQIALAL